MPHPLHVVPHGVLHLGLVHGAQFVHTFIIPVAVHVCEAGALPLCAPVALVTPLALLVIIAILAS